MPPNQFAHVTSCTPGMPRMTSAWLVGMLKIIDVERIVTTRVDELASATALKPSSTARSDANRKTAIATLRIVSAVRRLLRRALLRTSRANFIFSAPLADVSPGSARVSFARLKASRYVDDVVALRRRRCSASLSGERG